MDENTFSVPPVLQKSHRSQTLSSLEWDYTNTYEPSYFRDLPLDQVVDLDHILPLPSHVTDEPTNINLMDAQLLENRLPLTSTPLSPRPRISNLRRSLPIERERAQRISFPSFLQKFGLFKKK